jgi:hypothetical protein
MAARNGQFPGRNIGKHNSGPPMLPPFLFPPFGAPFFPNFPPMLNGGAPQNPLNEANPSSVFPTMTPEMLMMQIMQPNLFRQNGAFPQMLANAAAILERQKQQARDAAPQSPTTSVETPPSRQDSVKVEVTEGEVNDESPPESSPKLESSPKPTRKGGFGVSDLLNQ